MVAGHIVTEAHALVAAPVHIGRALRSGGRRGRRSRLAQGLGWEGFQVIPNFIPHPTKEG